MCGEFAIERGIVRGLPLRVEQCRVHAHASATGFLPDGTAFECSATRPTRDEAIRAVDRALADVEHLARCQQALPEVSSLLLGASVAAPGKMILRPTDRERGEARDLVARVLAHDNALPVRRANALLRAMDPSARAPVRVKRRAEAAYAELVRHGLERGVLIPRLQRAYNGGR